MSVKDHGRTGQIGILNVGAGDTKLVFDRNNEADCIRAARIVKDMIRRGYALLIEVDENGTKATRRVYEFREDTFEYIIADFDPVTAEQADKDEESAQKSAAQKPAPWAQGEDEPTPDPQKPRHGRQQRRAVSATSVSGIAVAPTAGG